MNRSWLWHDESTAFLVDLRGIMNCSRLRWIRLHISDKEKNNLYVKKPVSRRRNLFGSPNIKMPITETSRSKAWTVFARSNTGIVGSNPTQGMDVCVYSVFVLSCVGSGLPTGWFPVQELLPGVLRLRNLSETKRFTDALCSKVGATGKREKEREY
jgi:hypothetical protein